MMRFRRIRCWSTVLVAMVFLSLATGRTALAAGRADSPSTNPPPTVSLVTPGSGPTGGGTNVTISGANFAQGMGMWVYFGTSPSTAYSFVNSTTIQAYTPSHAAGAVDVTVVNPDRQSGTLANGFTYTASSSLPYVSSVTPNYGLPAGGTQVTLTGSAFSGATAVSFSGTPATSFAVVSDSTMTAVSPAHAAGVVHVLVTTPNGTNAQSSANQFTYTTSPPAVSAVSPTSGPTAGGTTVTVSGSNLTGATAVAFGDAPAASFAVLSDTSLNAVSPAHAATTVDITVTTPNGTSARTTSDQFTYTSGTPSPTVSGVSPSSGPVAGGTGVTVSGANFASGASVTFGGTPATGVSFVNSAVLTCVTPSHTAGAVDVVVSNPGGASGTLPGGFTYVAGSCSLACSASAPATAAAGANVAFSASAEPSGCSGQPAYHWTFGDGTTSNEQNPDHVYDAAGTFSWSMAATLDQASCAEYGSITVTPGVAPPVITSVKSASSPFRLKVYGSNFHPGCTVKVNGVPVPITAFKSATLVVAKSGARLKAMLPKGVTVQITVTNNDDGGTSAPFSYTR